MDGDAALQVSGPAFTVDGNIRLSGNALLALDHTAFNLANHYSFQYSIIASDAAQLLVLGCSFGTNAGDIQNSLTSSYVGVGTSLLRVEQSTINTALNWLLASFHDQARLEVLASPDLPTESYPHDASTVSFNGSPSGNRVWLEFTSGDSGLLDSLPDSNVPYTYSFGRDTGANVGFQVNIMNARIAIGVNVYPGSNVTVQDNIGPITIGYYFSDVMTPVTLSGFQPVGPANAVYSDQGRTFTLINARLEPFAWQLYNMGSGTPAVAPVTVDASTINEFAALNGGHFILENGILELAVLASNGAGSILEVNNSVINSQTLVSDGSSFLRVQDSTLFGPLVQATGDARIALLNNTLNHNVCHAQCKPLCLPMGVDSCNPFNPPNADVRFVVPDTSPVPNNAAILVAGVEPIAAPVTAGAMLQFTGDVLVESRNPAFMPYTYSLAYGRDFNSLVPITQNQAGPRRGQVLGALDTTSLNGAYVVVLTLNAGTVSLPVARPFSVQ